MGKLAENRHTSREKSRSVAHLRNRRRKLSAQLARIDKQLAKVVKPKKTVHSPQEVDRWLDELSAGLEHLPPLPDDFSRADLYDDHD